MSKLFNKLQTAKNYNGKFFEKVSLFFLLCKFPIKRRLYKKVNTEIGETFFNFKIFGYDYGTLAYLFKEIFIWNEYFFKPSTNAPIIIDCGANIGMSVFYFKKQFPNSKIIAFEANPYTYKLLANNVKINNLTDVETYNIALCEKDTEISFYIDNNIGTLRGSIKENRNGINELKIQAQKLSDYLKKYENVDLIKMDVEGAEVNIINDLFETSTINIAKEYIIEFHHNVLSSESKLSQFLHKFETNGFKYNIKASYNGVDDEQDIMIHFYK